MTISRVTQRMMTQQSLTGVQSGLGRLAAVQEQLTTGRRLNRPSDSPADTATAMRLRSARSESDQHVRNGEDARGWLDQLDTALQSMSVDIRRARELALAGANDGAVGRTGREALAVEVEQVRQSLLATANTTYLDRPVLGGVTAGAQAYDTAGAYVGTPGDVRRTIAPGVDVTVNLDGRSVMGPDGAGVLQDLTALAAALRSGDGAGIRAGLTAMDAAADRVGTALTDVGGRAVRVDRALAAASDTALSLATRVSDVEDVDLAEVAIEVRMREVAYQAALGATSRVLQPSLMDFLR
jgi:flagellar hook-associated protein 3 FlgL